MPPKSVRCPINSSGLFAFLFAVLLFPAPALAEDVVTIKTRPGVTLKFILRGARAGNLPIAILFAGGGGDINLDNWDGSGNPAGNFLVRTRKHWVKHDLLVAVPDAPSDQKSGMFRWRTSKDHTTDIRALIKHLRKYTSGPAFLIGTSRGTISAAGIAGNMAPNKLGGIVLTATVTRYNAGGDKDRLESANLANIKVPVLFAHHKDDACDVTRFEDLPALAKKITRAPKVAIRGYSGDGGKSYRGSECASKTAHGFRGIEKQVVRETAEWIHEIAGTPR
ncbi:MAG: alpha/beta hydrolase [Rhodospirillales bacterium]|jgi:hypothetical protein|nr:alpha/beta hydrolase [Rhodospirillales bacterium]MBT4006466.1 alpha/beta hydrolase [Rhodospirillales bacterium]MBT5076246.1 alpha/beta hydrolase [Rhodospirillales bacterium]MBT5113744.1 alpha/beta hydrolase [Rhodospirillales bacterium]MBT5672272.1 alpha/beta hydrolase [Rhodospirillales bacterium]